MKRLSKLLNTNNGGSSLFRLAAEYAVVLLGFFVTSAALGATTQITDYNRRRCYLNSEASAASGLLAITSLELTLASSIRQPAILDSFIISLTSLSLIEQRALAI
jgi:hypothetical protein